MAWKRFCRAVVPLRASEESSRFERADFAVWCRRGVVEKSVGKFRRAV